MSANPQPSSTVPTILLPEILSFSPQLLLDDVINIANDAVTIAVNAMEEFLQRWAEDYAKTAGDDWDSIQEVEQGLVSFQTLLESHTDIAFDFFEAWSLRNIFTFPADLPIVTRHHEGLNLQETPERELELMAEIEELRRKIDDQRRLKRLFTRALRKSTSKLRSSSQRLERLSFLHSPTLVNLSHNHSEFLAMYNLASRLPPLDPSAMGELTQLRPTDPGKRQWETSRTGYSNWAVGQLLTRTKEGGAIGSSAVGDAAMRAAEIGNPQVVRAALENIGETLAQEKR